MKPIFFARGPDFRKGVKSTSILSVDIYPLVCRLLNIEAAPNNGSLERTAQFLVDEHSSTQGGGMSSASSHAHISWLCLSAYLLLFVGLV